MIRRSRGGLLKGAALSCILTLGGAGYADQGLSPTEHAAGASHPAHISSPSTLESIVETPDDKVETPVAKPDRKTLFSQMYNIEPVEDSKPLVPVGEVDVTDGYHLDDTVKVGHWNLEIYGNKKAFGHNGKRRLLIAKEIKKYDILFLQEISDARGNAIQALCDDLPGYNCWASSRAGGRYHKEQIVVVARNYIPLMDSHDYNPNKDFTRPPVSATFIVPGQQGNLVGKFWSTHVDPDRVATELRQWEKLVESANTQHPEYVFGDVNYDCKYANPRVIKAFSKWGSAIGDDADTTTTGTDCAYDRFWFRSPFFVRGINDVPHRGLGRGQAKRLSNHHIVGAELKMPSYDLAQVSSLGFPKMVEPPALTPLYIASSE